MGLNHQRYRNMAIFGKLCRLGCHIAYHQAKTKSQGHLYETSCNIFVKSLKRIDINISLKNIESYAMQADICHSGTISHNKSDHKVMREKARDVLMRCPATHLLRVWHRLKSFFSLKNIESYSIQADICHQDIISHNNSDGQVIKNPRDILMRRPANYGETVLKRLSSI